MAFLARTARRIALALTITLWAAAGMADENPHVLDDEGRLSDAFIAEVRRQDEAQFRKQYTVNYTEHNLDYAVGWRASDEPPHVAENTGYVKADLVTGEHEVRQTVIRREPNTPAAYVGSTSSGAGYQPMTCDPYKWAYRISDTWALADVLDRWRDDVTSVSEEPAADGVLLRIAAQARESHETGGLPRLRRELVLNRSRGYRPQQIVEYDDKEGTRTQTDIDLEWAENAGIWTASRVRQRTYDVRDDTEELRHEVIFEFTDFTPRTHLRFRHP